MKFRTEEHYGLVTRQIQKMFNHINKTIPREIRRKQGEYRALKSLLNKLMPLGVPDGMHLKDINFNRQELRMLQSLCTNGRRLLNEYLIPGYEERMKKEEKEEIKKKYQEYIDKNQKTDIVYSELLTDIEANL